MVFLNRGSDYLCCIYIIYIISKKTEENRKSVFKYELLENEIF